MSWFLYDKELRHERAKRFSTVEDTNFSSYVWRCKVAYLFKIFVMKDKQWKINNFVQVSLHKVKDCTGLWELFLKVKPPPYYIANSISTEWNIMCKRLTKGFQTLYYN